MRWPFTRKPATPLSAPAMSTAAAPVLSTAAAPVGGELARRRATRAWAGGPILGPAVSMSPPILVPLLEVPEIAGARQLARQPDELLGIHPEPLGVELLRGPNHHGREPSASQPGPPGTTRRAARLAPPRRRAAGTPRDEPDGSSGEPDRASDGLDGSRGELGGEGDELGGSSGDLGDGSTRRGGVTDRAGRARGASERFGGESEELAGASEGFGGSSGDLGDGGAGRGRVTGRVGGAGEGFGRASEGFGGARDGGGAEGDGAGGVWDGDGAELGVGVEVVGVRRAPVVLRGVGERGVFTRVTAESVGVPREPDRPFRSIGEYERMLAEFEANDVAGLAMLTGFSSVAAPPPVTPVAEIRQLPRPSLAESRKRGLKATTSTDPDPTETSPHPPTTPNGSTPTDRNRPTDRSGPTDRNAPVDRSGPTDWGGPADRGAPMDRRGSTDRSGVVGRGIPREMSGLPLALGVPALGVTASAESGGVGGSVALPGAGGAASGDSVVSAGLGGLVRSADPKDVEAVEAAADWLGVSSTSIEFSGPADPSRESGESGEPGGDWGAGGVGSSGGAVGPGSSGGGDGAGLFERGELVGRKWAVRAEGVRRSRSEEVVGLRYEGRLAVGVAPDSLAEASVGHEVMLRLGGGWGMTSGEVPVRRGPGVGVRANELGARAFTADGVVYLPAEAGELSDPAVQGLLAHELTHFAQQRVLGADLPSADSAEGRWLEGMAVRAEQRQRSSGVAIPLVHKPIEHPSAGPAPTERIQAAPVGGELTWSMPDHFLGDNQLLSEPAGSEFTQLHDPADGVPAAQDPSAGWSSAWQRPAPPAATTDPDVLDRLDRLEVTLDEIQDRSGPDLADLEVRLDDPSLLSRLAERLYANFRHRLRSELLIDRERHGALADPR